MNEYQLYKEIYRQMLDYADLDFVHSCAKWGYNTQKKIESNGRAVSLLECDKNYPFFYAVSTALILCEFAKISFNDYFSEETEIELGLLGMDFNNDNMEIILNDDIEEERKELLLKNNVVGLQDIWEFICDFKKEIYNGLVYSYEQEGIEYPNFKILVSMGDLFNEDSVEKFYKTGAYSYVEQGFQY